MSTSTALLKGSYYYLTPISLVRKRRHREVKALAQGHRASEMKSWDLKEVPLRLVIKGPSYTPFVKITQYTARSVW